MRASHAEPRPIVTAALADRGQRGVRRGTRDRAETGLPRDDERVGVVAFRTGIYGATPQRCLSSFRTIASMIIPLSPRGRPWPYGP